MLAAPMLVAVLITALVAVLPIPGADTQSAVPRVPAERDAVFLPEATTYQVVVADLDGDGARELVRLVSSEGGGIAAEAWAEQAGAWSLLDSIPVVPPSPPGGELLIVYNGAPAQLVTRRVGGRDRVTLVRVPIIREAAFNEPCCMLLDDLILEGDRLRLANVAQASTSADILLALDMDGDGTDELLATRSLPPLGDISYPTEARVFRWSGTQFAAPTLTELPVGSGDAPFVLGDSDGRPGAEAALITSVGTRTLHRIALGPGDRLVTENSRLAAGAATAVPIGDGVGIAIVARPSHVTVRRWPAGEPITDPIGAAEIPGASLAGVVSVGDDTRLLIRQDAPEALHALLLPDLIGIRSTGIPRSPSAAAIASGPVQPFRGPLSIGFEEQVQYLFDGRLFPVATGDDAPFPLGGSVLTSAFAAVEPVGTLGAGGRWLALQHGALANAPGPRGGILLRPHSGPGSGVSIVPWETELAGPEADDGRLQPEISGAFPIPGTRTLAVGPDGFHVQIAAPPSTRLYVADADPSVLAAALIVPSSGSLDVALAPRRDAPSGSRHRVAITAVTPAGRSYLATWDVRLLVEPPRLSATVTTPFASPSVIVEGQSAPFATVTVAGRPVELDGSGRFSASVEVPPWPTDVEVVATDAVGNVATLAVSGVGLLDYRTLPWLPILVVAVACVGVGFYLWVPHSRPEPRAAGDDAVLEEMDPD